MQSVAMFVFASTLAVVMIANGMLIDRYDHMNPPAPMDAFFSGMAFSSALLGFLGAMLTLLSLLCKLSPSEVVTGDTLG